jgi:hypothetical protein
MEKHEVSGLAELSSFGHFNKSVRFFINHHSKLMLYKSAYFMASQLVGWWGGGGGTICSTHRNIQKPLRYTQLHEILAMKVWF